MTRPIVAVSGTDPAGVLAALESSLAGGGPAILPLDGPLTRPLPELVARRVAVVIETSGSTARPKRVALSADAILASAAASDSALGGPGQWVLALPATYIAGINVLARSIAAGTSPVLLPPGRFDPAGFVAACRELTEPVRYTSLVPAQLIRLLDSPDQDVVATLRRFDGILVGGQATPLALVERTRDLGIRIVRTYGSSETSGGCVYDGIPIGQVEARVIDGEIQLSGPVLAEGYLDDPARTEEAFVTEGARRWYRTGDAGSLSAGVIAVTGRLDDTIISGGLKVPLGEVESLVRGIPGLAGAVVISRADDEWGEVPVVVSSVPVDLAMLRASVSASLGRAAAPAQVVVAPIPLLASGKPDRRALRAALAPRNGS